MAIRKREPKEVELELGYDARLDEYGVYDGRDIARELIRDAVKFLVPYAGECPACTGDLFSVIANEVLEELSPNVGEASRMVESYRLTGHKDAEEGAEAFVEHMRQTEAKTKALLAKAHRSDGHGHD